ncbi:MAG TPA: hypothetical protein VHR66_05925 [Gemmataceae bacterium]|jgi:hypothetical protein|nr:hypothetical protein [Gemmataceae bacterium]
MAWVNWNRKTQDPSITRGPLGVDLNAGRARAAHGRAGRNKLFPLDDPRTDLALGISLEKRVAEVGPAAALIARRLPHMICTGYLPCLGQTQDWKAGRHALTPETATTLAIERLRGACQGHDGIGLALPTYLTLSQTGKLLAIAEKAKLKIRGTATVPLALAAERATHYLHGQPEDTAETPRTGRSFTPTTVLIVDADDHAMTVSLVRIAEEEVRLQGAATFPRLGVRFWRERLLDAMADRCVRLCRRDPRDSADAEQMLFDQVDDAIDRARTGQRVALTIRAMHWFQDLVLTPADMDAFCLPLCRNAADEVRHLLASLNEADPPRAAWLTHDAGRLPGLAAALHQNMTERTNVRVLHPEAAAAAVANLNDRWEAGNLPRTHLDTMIPLPPRVDARIAPRSPVGRR